MITKERLGGLNETEAVSLVPQSLVIDTQVARSGLSAVLSSNSVDKVAFLPDSSMIESGYSCQQV